ncbi:Ig-like domain-containing protein [Geothermobacter hydrogeniphilus]|uniref:BIG2 domain-containing protein n=1 Tax=Geothermobacter hydrogeniphilus TaxID=1969733 RepID=A0A1X0Y1P6_9BACT|nr:Ig-like domain-containing protein [Geothermobacter hydrogeniphilus]ORJ59073.1 hypothetical protein B5V00_10920 [Geothermobacter hydrogeniphilus]
MRFCLWFPVLLLGLLTGCGSSNDATRSNNFLPLTAIEVTSSLSQIANLTSAQLTAIGNFSGQFTRDITAEVAWSSSDPAIATVDNQPGSEGRVTAVAPGTVTLTADLDGVTAVFLLTVSNATISTLTLSPLTPSVGKGLTRQFTATGTFSDATSQDLTSDVSWSSTVPTVAAISNSRGSEGLASALLEGTTDISATFDGMTASTTMTVTAAVLQSLALAPQNAAMVSLSLRSFTATGSFSDGTNQDLTAQVAWSSSDATVAEIDATGVVTSLKSGQTTISATLNGVNAGTGLKVTGGDLTGISITPVSPLTLVAGTRAQLTATGQFSNNTSRDITSLVTWNSGTQAVASISNVSGLQGRLSALAQGTSIITATYDTFSPSLSLTVSTPGLNRLDISPSAPIIFIGTKQAFAVTGIFAGGLTQDLSLDAAWSSSNSAVAGIGTVDPVRGVATGVAAGQTTISAAFGGVPDGTATLDVQAATLQSLSIVPLTVNVSPGATVQLAVTATYSGGSQDVSADVIWSSPDESIATFMDLVRHPGLLTGVDVGTIDVQAAFGGQTATVTVNVQ